MRVAVVDAVRERLAALTRPSVNEDELFVIFEKLGLAETATELRPLMTAEPRLHQ
jgi:hypothetical protein